MYNFNDSIRRLTDSMMENEIRKLERKFKDQAEARRYVEFAIESALERLFSKAGIARAAEKLDGDRSLAVTVMLAAFAGEHTQEIKEEYACHQCDNTDVAVLLPYESHPVRVVCPECGLMNVTVRAGA